MKKILKLIFKFGCLVAYIACVAVIIFESCLDSNKSSEHSDAVGDEVADIINGVTGDQAEEIIHPTEIQITNKTNKIMYTGGSYTLNVITLPSESIIRSYLFTTSDSSVATVNQQGKVSFKKAGIVTITAICENYEELTDSTTFEVKVAELTSLSASLNAPVNGGVYEITKGNTYAVKLSAAPSNVNYVTKYSSSNTSYASVSASGVIKGVNVTSTPVTITITANNLSTTIQVIVLPALDPIYPTEFNANLKYNYYDGTTSDLNIEDDMHKLRLGETMKVNASVDSQATIKSISFSSSNTEVATINGSGLITPVQLGTTTITINEAYTNITYEFEVKVVNLVLINTEEPIKIGGKRITLDDDHKITIINGYDGEVHINFTENSTYTDVTYTSSNESVATVGVDGSIIPLKVGKTVITINCVDENSDVNLSYEITLEVDPKPFVEVAGNFLRFIRKGIGHFGAFLVLGIFSTLTYLLFFKPKKWILSIPFNFVQGFMIAALTEYIQTFVPGRYGAMSDVLLDFFGFITSAILITIGFLISLLIKKLRRR